MRLLRLLACVAEEHRDAQGLMLPVTVAQYQVALVALARKQESWQVAEAVLAGRTPCRHTCNRARCFGAGPFGTVGANSTVCCKSVCYPALTVFQAAW